MGLDSLHTERAGVRVPRVGESPRPGRDGKAGTTRSPAGKFCERGSGCGNGQRPDQAEGRAVGLYAKTNERHPRSLKEGVV